MYKKSAAFIKFSLGNQLEDQSKAIITSFEKTSKENRSHLYCTDQSLMIEENGAKIYAKQSSNQKWNNISNYKMIMKGKSQEGDVKFQDYKKVDELKCI